MMSQKPTRTQFFPSPPRPSRYEACLLLSLLVGPFLGAGVGAGHSSLRDTLAVDEPVLLDCLVSAANGFLRYSRDHASLQVTFPAHLPPLDDNRHPLVPGILRKCLSHMAESLSRHWANMDGLAEIAHRILANLGEWARPVCTGMLRYLGTALCGLYLALGQHGYIPNNHPVDSPAYDMVGLWETKET